MLPIVCTGRTRKRYALRISGYVPRYSSFFISQADYYRAQQDILTETPSVGLCLFARPFVRLSVCLLQATSVIDNQSSNNRQSLHRSLGLFSNEIFNGVTITEVAKYG